jgi:hypothetical protein
LREATRKQNTKNIRLRKINKTGIKGVSLFENRFRVVVTYRGRKVHIGLFDTIDAATKAAQIARRKYYGRFA